VTSSPSFEDAAAVLELFLGASTRNDPEATMSDTTSEHAMSTSAIRPFTVEVPQAEIEALRARVAAMRWPDEETVDDRSQGVPGTSRSSPLTSAGIGLTDKPQDGYDTATLAGDQELVRGREDIFFGYEFAIQGGNVPGDALRYYFSIFSDPDVLRGSFGFYRAWDATLAQNEQRKTRPLTMPVLAIGGAASWGEAARDGG
jgi:hypothetical protein